MAYTPDYTADDLAAAAIDGGVKIIITLASLAVIFAFLLAWAVIKLIAKR